MTQPKKVINGWELFEAKSVFHARVFELYEQPVRVQKRHYETTYYYLHSVDWVNVIPITTANEVVLIRQLRPAVGEECLEIPGGLIDPQDPSPQHAALRELEEETGFTSPRVESLGSVYPNPAINDNRTHLFVAYEATATGRQTLETGEDIRLEIVPLADIPMLILEGKILHSLVLNAFLKYFLIRAEERKAKEFGKI